MEISPRMNRYEVIIARVGRMRCSYNPLLHDRPLRRAALTINHFVQTKFRKCSEALEIFIDTASHQLVNVHLPEETRK